VNQIAAGFRHDGKKLRIELPAPAAIATELSIAISYRGATAPRVVLHRPDDAYPGKPVQVWSQGQDEDLALLVPCFDAPNVKATSEVTVTVPAPLFAVSNGTLISDRIRRRAAHAALAARCPAQLLPDHAGDRRLRDHRDPWRDVPVVYYVERGREAAAERTLARTPEMLELFSRRFGVPYPYPRYAQVFRRRLHLRRHGEHQRDDPDRHRAARRARGARIMTSIGSS